MSDQDSVRLDIWLDVACLFKTRSQAQTACRRAPHGESGTAEQPEIPSVGMDLVTFYARNLAVPARQAVDRPEVLAGKALFHAAGCAG